MWAFCRCFWINFVRIANFVAVSSPEDAQKSVNRWIFPLLCDQNTKIWQMLSRFLHSLASGGKDVALFWEWYLFSLSFVKKSALVLILKK